jgi:asparagine synthetase B (glutamine-hydrolysing)
LAFGSLFMPDFLISLDPAVDPSRLLALLKQPYGEEPPPGRFLRYPWGSIAVLEDGISARQNIRTVGDLTFASIGEFLFPGGSGRLGRILEQLGTVSSSPSAELEVSACLRKSGFLDDINGAFAWFLATPDRLLLATDPMGSVQVYVGKNPAGQPIALGTHPDLVARLCRERYVIEPVSVCDFLNVGTPCCPATMHRDVTEVWPGTVRHSHFAAGRAATHGEFRYWVPPEADPNPGNGEELVAAFVERWHKAVASRCQGDPIAVQLSGGMDSRLVLAAIPAERKCVTVTLCDTINREARFARKVARCYRREWIPLHRDPEYLGRTAIAATRFTGCEGEWHHGHTIGFAQRLNQMGVQSVFTGLLMDNNFKGYYARDFQRVSRFGGLAPTGYRVVPMDYANQVSPFCREHLLPGCVAGSVARRQAFSENHLALRRESRCEWLDGYPYSQACDNTGWVIERRVMPMRLPLMDRSLLEIAFRTPMRLKAGGRFFDQAAVRILGPGRSIPSANDGVRPGSGHTARLLQRALRKCENKRRSILTKLGVQLQVPHSWHDFRRYLHESPVIGELIASHGTRLREFEGPVFSSDPTRLLRNPAVPWEIGYRLVQLAVWRSILDEYHI